MPNDRLPKHKKRLATDSQGEQNVLSPAARPAPNETNTGGFGPQQKRNTTPAGTIEDKNVSEVGSSDENKEKQ